MEGDHKNEESDCLYSAGIFLLINAWYDIRKRKILLHSIWIFTVLWILFLMFVDKEKIWQAFGGILPECFCLPVLIDKAGHWLWRWTGSLCVRSVSWNGTDLCDVVLCIAVLFRVSAVMLCVKRGLTRQAAIVPYLIAGYLCTFCNDWTEMKIMQKIKRDLNGSFTVEAALLMTC